MLITAPAAAAAAPSAGKSALPEANYLLHFVMISFHHRHPA
jgi:hypothetical protein